MDHVAVGLIAIVGGVVAFLFRRPSSQANVAFQRTVLRVGWGEREVKVGEAGIIILAVLRIAFGIVALTGLVPMAGTE